MKRNWKLWSGCLAVVFLLASCASTAHIEKDDNTDFRKFKTFAWIDKDRAGKQDRNRNNDLIERNVRETVNKELEKTAGWRETINDPDVLLSYDVLVEKTVAQRSNPVYSSPF